MLIREQGAGADQIVQCLALMQICYDGQLLMIDSGHRAQPLLTLRHAFLPEKVLQRLQESLFLRWPLLDASELAEGYNAISIDMNMEGDGSVPPNLRQ